MVQRRFNKLLLCSIVLLGLFVPALAQQWNPNHSIGTINGVYHYSYNQTPAQLVEIHPAAYPNTGLTYQWQKGGPATFTDLVGETQATLTFTGPLGGNAYFRRKTISGGNYIYSNVVKITVVSQNWEDINYVREHNVSIAGITDWQGVDQLTIGGKKQTTNYLDGLGRSVQSISRESATPATPNGLWGDIVQFSQYDAYGREPLKYLPYTTTTQSGKFKTAPLIEQPQYYAATYNENSAYSSITFDNSPLNRSLNVKQSGTTWAGSSGTFTGYDLNSVADNVQKFTIGYMQGSAPVNAGAYPVNSLYKSIRINESGKKQVIYTDQSGRLILTKTQFDDNPSDGHTGWICTYSVYDDFGLLRCRIQPEGVKYLEANSWSFAGSNGQLVLTEQCFLYAYDDKRRMIWSKTPGADPLNTIFDIRDRPVFRQDGNQEGLSTPQWITIFYDELDRPIASALYNTSKTIANLKTDIANAPALNSFTINNAGTVSITLAASLNPVSSGDLNNASATTILKYNFYDNYSFPALKPFNTSYNNLSAYSSSDPGVEAIGWSKRTVSMETGSMTRVLGTSNFLFSTQYYDDKGRPIQLLFDNIKSGLEIGTLQYHFDGRVLSSCSDHTTPGTDFTGYKILTKYNFDKLGRVISLQKQFGGNAFKTISSYEYDDFGRVKIKHLDPGYTTGGNADLESMVYTYNIHNQITGINKDYALKTPGNYDKWGHFFGLYLGFDNKENIFSASNLNGQVTGLLWNTQGDDAQRRYDYTYDNAGRLENAAFTEKQHTGDAWSNGQMDFSVNGASGKITYDLNGNLLNMLHKGVLPGTSTPIVVDNLNYTYASYSNKLQSVTDLMANTSVNGKFGDFKDGSNGSNPDYVYDANGNLVIDLNKNAKDLAGVIGANGIKYNFLDKPEEIRIVGKGVIKIVYSAAGEKLQRVYIPEPGGATITTTYINQYVYQESSAGGGLMLQYISFEEGRIRAVQPTSQGNGLDALVVDGNMDLPGGRRGAYDFYIKDYQSNVRMVLTEEIHSASNTATMETSRSSLEESIFGQSGGNNEVAATRYPTSSTSWQHANIGTHVSRVGTNAGRNIGPNTLQKVMAGDKLTATVQYFHQSNSGGNSASFPNAVLSSLVQAISGGSTTQIIQENASAITTQLAGVNGFVTAVQPAGSNPSGTTPQAFLTILFFDERFNFISASDGGVSQQQVEAFVGSNGSSLTLPSIKAPKNGYAYVYVSNQSNNDVYFDNLVVGKIDGNIVEENHYYAFGLKVSSISSKKLGDSYEGNLRNNYLYNGKEIFEDADLNWYDYGFRNYDPQIGRFVQTDPLANYYPIFSQYLYAGNDPIGNIDFMGMGPEKGLTAATAVSLGEVVIRSVRTSAKVVASNGLKIATFTTLQTLEIVVTGGKIINGSNDTRQAGDAAVDNGDNGIDRDGYEPLTKEKLYEYYKKNNPNVDEKVLDQNVGYYFEGLWDDAASKNLEKDADYRPNPDIRSELDGNLFKPDGLSNTIRVDVYYRGILNSKKVRTIYYNAAWYEVKAKNRGIYKSSDDFNQLLDYAQELVQSERSATLMQATKLFVITTANMKISPSVNSAVSATGVELIHLVAYFKELANGQLEIIFKKRSWWGDYASYPIPIIAW